MKRILSVLAICALCAVASIAWADEPTAPPGAPIVLAEDNITAPIVDEASGAVNTPPVPVNTTDPTVNATPAAVNEDLPSDWGPGDYTRLVALKLLPTVVYVVGGLLLTLASIGIYYLKKYTGITVTSQQFGMMQDIAGAAWKTVEERARAGLLKLPDGTPPPGAKKLEAAMDVAEGLAQEMGLPKMARERLGQLIEAKLLEGRG